MATTKPAPIQVLFVSMGGQQWGGEDNNIPGELVSRLHAQFDPYAMKGGIKDHPSHFARNPAYFQKERGVGAAKDYDVIVYTGHDGSSYDAAEDIEALVRVHNGVLAARPALFLRCSHFFARGYHEKYRELLGIGSRSHEPAKPEGTYRFPNPDDVCVEGLDTAAQTAPDNVCTNTYYDNGGYYGSHLVPLVAVEKQVFSCPIAWKYEYSNRLSGGTGMHPRMFAHVYDISSGGGSAPFTSVMWDIVARSLIWAAGKDNATYLTSPTTSPEGEAAKRHEMSLRDRDGGRGNR
jgi:hypothetical protein